LGLTLRRINCCFVRVGTNSVRPIATCSGRNRVGCGATRYDSGSRSISILGLPRSGQPSETVLVQLLRTQLHSVPDPGETKSTHKLSSWQALMPLSYPKQQTLKSVLRKTCEMSGSGAPVRTHCIFNGFDVQRMRRSSFQKQAGFIPWLQSDLYPSYAGFWRA